MVIDKTHSGRSETKGQINKSDLHSGPFVSELQPKRTNK